ncbi:MAG: hypothetical protein COA99_07025 [Moraxellaceae bacterium]|nr:MAG: hypothetical protein COA99_07025 [Moraxellaceae bacterium]
MKISQKITLGTSALVIFATLSTATILSVIAEKKVSSALQTQVKNNLTAVRESTKIAIENYFQMINFQIQTLSNDRMIIDATIRFKTAFDNYKTELFVEDVSTYRNKLTTYYTEEFNTEYRKRNNGLSFEVNSLTRQLDDESVLLQYSYIKANENALGEKDKLISLNNQTSYDQFHSLYHPHIKDYLDRFGYYDIFIVNPDSGDIVYSVFKELDYSTSLKNGPFSNSGIGEVFDKANKLTSTTEFVITDFSAYTPSYEDPASFIASPIFDGDKKIGILIFQMPIGRINDIMTHHSKWKQNGLGETGETYLVAADKTLRSMSRFLIEDSKSYLAALKVAGTDEKLIKKIEAKQTSISLQPSNTPGVIDALAGNTDFDTFPDYRNVPVLSAYAPVNIQGLNWVVMSEIDVAEAYAPIQTMKATINTAALFLCIVLASIGAGLSWIFSSYLVRPLNTVVDAIKNMVQGEGDLTQRLSYLEDDELGDLSNYVNSLMEKLQSMLWEMADLINALATSSTQLRTAATATTADIQDQQIQTELLATAMNEMTATVHEVAISAQNSAQGAESAKSQTSAGFKIMNQSIDEIDSLVQKVTSSAEAIQILTNDTANIGSVLDVIKSIAEQTNLLALNAAIEAARAGEQGRGFAVVADEVRTLASKTQESTNEIEGMIEKLQSAAKNAVIEMEHSQQSANAGKAKMAETGAALGEILDAVDKISGLNFQIASAAEEQSNVAEEINRNVVSINTSGEGTAKSAEQTSVSSEKLTEVAQKLQHLVQLFKI